MTLGDNGRFGVARYRHRGQPDEDFGDGGVASANFTPFNDEGKALDFQPCGAAPDGASKTCIVMVGKAQPLEDGPGDVALVYHYRAGPDGEDPQADADARLIAAAPELLRALEAIVARVTGEFDSTALEEFGPLSTWAADDIIALARAAIAKTTGEGS